MITRIVVTTLGIREIFDIGNKYTIADEKKILKEIIAFEKSFCLIFESGKKITYQNVSFYFVTDGNR